MNANELADNLIPFATDYKISNLDCMILSDAITMLRQQQAEIEKWQTKFQDLLLKYGNLYDERYENIGRYCKHESWKKRADRMTLQCQSCGLEADELSRTYKVYVDITDEEIDEIADKFGAGMEQFGGCLRHLDFARAILRKAQEK